MTSSQGAKSDGFPLLDTRLAKAYKLAKTHKYVRIPRYVFTIPVP